MASKSTTAHNITATPTHNSSPIDMDINALLRNLQDNADDDSTTKKRKFVHLSSDRFSILMKCFQQQQLDIGRLIDVASPVSQQHITDTSHSHSHSK
jgi:hypothetical protein